MKISYYLNAGRKKNLYCRISDGSDRVSFSLGYTIDPKEWNEIREEGSFEDPYYFTLMSFKKYLTKRYHELKSLEIPTSSVLATMKKEAETFVDGSGIEGIARKMFDDENKDDDIPTYDQFIEAFEKYSQFQKGEYKTQSVGNLIHFYTESGNVYEMDTYQGLHARLKLFLERMSYDEILTETNESHWSEVYVDAGIEKYIFIPRLLREWETFWRKQYKEILDEIGRTNHLDELKNASWRQLQAFMECYNDARDIVRLAIDIDEMKLYPLVVLTMLNIFDANTCFSEYCELEFYSSDEWESIDLCENEEIELEVETKTIFHIKELEL